MFRPILTGLLSCALLAGASLPAAAQPRGDHDLRQRMDRLEQRLDRLTAALERSMSQNRVHTTEAPGVVQRVITRSVEASPQAAPRVQVLREGQPSVHSRVLRYEGEGQPPVIHLEGEDLETLEMDDARIHDLLRAIDSEVHGVVTDGDGAVELEFHAVPGNTGELRLLPFQHELRNARGLYHQAPPTRERWGTATDHASRDGMVRDLHRAMAAEDWGRVAHLAHALQRIDAQRDARRARSARGAYTARQGAERALLELHRAHDALRDSARGVERARGAIRLREADAAREHAERALRQLRDRMEPMQPRRGQLHRGPAPDPQAGAGDAHRMLELMLREAESMRDRSRDARPARQPDINELRRRLDEVRRQLEAMGRGR